MPWESLVLWEGSPGDGHGGTAWAVSHLHECGVPVENIFPARERSMPWEPKDAAAAHATSRPIRAMLFADCKGYSKLREEKVAEFTEGFLSGVARLIEDLRGDGCAPIMANTWGDGIFMVFETVRAAGVFATALRDALLQREESPRFPKDIVVRIGLHAGPVTPFFDPVTRRQNFTGHNVAFAARIEPIAAENQIYVSEAFAALAAERGLDEFQFEYLGETRLGKEFGRFRLYQLQSTAYRP
jgi:class 3 adenylate cyclase